MQDEWNSIDGYPRSTSQCSVVAFGGRIEEFREVVRATLAGYGSGPYELERGFRCLSRRPS
jgi:hypothetical protein